MEEQINELFLKISKESNIPYEEISGVYLDEEKGEQLIFTTTQIINQLKKICPQINTSFDIIYEKEFQQFSSEISEILPLLHIGYQNSEKNNDKLCITCGDLIRNATNTLISSFQCLRDGYVLQSGILIRSAVEMCCTVIHLHTKPNDLEDFLNDNLKSTRSVGIANSQIPVFGKFWGILSQKQIHINQLHTDFYSHEPLTKKEIPYEITISLIFFAVILLRITTELIYHNHSQQLVYWSLETNGKLKFEPPSYEQLEWLKNKLKPIIGNIDII